MSRVPCLCLIVVICIVFAMHCHWQMIAMLVAMSVGQVLHTVILCAVITSRLLLHIKELLSEYQL